MLLCKKAWSYHRSALGLHNKPNRKEINPVDLSWIKRGIKIMNLFAKQSTFLYHSKHHQSEKERPETACNNTNSSRLIRWPRPLPTVVNVGQKATRKNRAAHKNRAYLLSHDSLQPTVPWSPAHHCPCLFEQRTRRCPIELGGISVRPNERANVRTSVRSPEGPAPPPQPLSPLQVPASRGP